MKISKRFCIQYGALAVPLFWLTISLFVFLPKFYIEQGVVSFQTLGIAAVLFRVVDAVLDVLIGRFLERSKKASYSLLKRIQVAALPLGLATIVVFTPSILSGYGLPPGILLLPFLLVFVVCLTAIQISYEGVIPNLASNYSERSRLLSYRSAGILIGSLLSSAAPFVLFQYVSKELAYLSIGIVIALLLNAIAILNARTISYSGEKAETEDMVNVFSRAKSLLAEAPVRNLVIAFVFTSIGAALPAALILFFVEHVIGSTRGPLFVAIYLLVAILSLPLWMLVAKRLEKNTCWIAGICLNAGALLYIFTLGSGDETAYGLAVAVSAIGYGSTILFPASMQADVVDYDQWKFGVRREAEIASLCLFTKKTFAALGLGLTFLLLGEGAGQLEGAFKSAPQLVKLRLFYALVPALISIFGVIWVAKYRLKESDVNRIQSELS